MFNKYRNIKKIGLVLIGLAVVIFLITNVRIRSVDSYRKQFSNMAGSSQTQPDRPDNNDRLQDETISTDNANAADNGSFYETGDGAGNGAVSDDNSASESTDNIAATDNNSGSGTNESDRGNGTAISGGNDSGSSNSGNSSSGNNNSGSNNSGNNSQNTRPAGKVISCTIEIRCDNATARKDSITNPGIRDAIPDDGTILEVTTYTAVEGFTVYDVLAAVTAMHDPVIPIVANSDKSYVLSINNLSEKNVGPQSGWTYRVNGVLPMMAANQYTVKDGDVIKWIYVCQLGDK